MRIENQLFNSISIITLIYLLAMVAFNIYVGQFLLGGILVVVAAALYLVYYLSRFRGKYNLGVYLFGFLSYPVLAINFYLNDGIEGPSFYVFLMVHIILISFSNSKTYWVWIGYNFLFFVSLFYIDNFYPEIIPEIYGSDLIKFWDHSVTYLASILGIFAIVLSHKTLYQFQKKKTEAKSQQLLQVNQELAKSNEEKDKLIALISHDLRSPLLSIVQILEFMAEGNFTKKEMEKTQKDLLLITNNTQKMMENILEWATFKLQNTEIILAETNIKSSMESMMKVFVPLAKQKGIDLKVDFKDHPVIKTNEERLLLILRNIVQNAIKFTSAGGKVHCTVKQHGEQTWISISDTGVGIPEQHLEKLFELNINATYGTGKEKGTGLGLYLCKENADTIGATISVKSQVGEGTTFTITLPKNPNL